MACFVTMSLPINSTSVGSSRPCLAVIAGHLWSMLKSHRRVYTMVHGRFVPAKSWYWPDVAADEVGGGCYLQPVA